MMYKNQVAVALKHKGKILREVGETVFLPFGAEYSLFIKNMNNVRAVATITIDGQDVGDGTQFIVNANDSLDLERFIKNGNLSEGNRFKFIERSGAVEQHRGIGVEDGLIRIEFAFEKRQPVITYREPAYFLKGWDNSHHYDTKIVGGTAAGSAKMFTADSNEISSCATPSPPVNDVGITVPGSVSDQQFHTVSDIRTETETYVMVFKIVGETKDNQQIVEPITVKSKPKCISCGKLNKATANFCSKCGTSLILV